MLELKNIVKDYSAGEMTVHALKGIDLAFRSNEFVSILGPSGCGKTTMLNIIGGLDGYTSGDLVINGKSTREFKDRDWDTYRNHSIGFVFQSYNLIPHQTVLRNVEIALSLSGVRGKERKQRAVAALEQVGLGDQLGKRPSEMSGGQMQRVAIARALVNDPDILLLDEPTGALDTETGIMVMEILKKVASDRLVIMVTHNPELAEQYSTRIVRMLDGKIMSDSMPLSDEEKEAESRAEKEKAEADARKKIPRMRFHTAFGLSLNNLFTKRGRTLLTSLAGSIGIIGIALIYAVSQGTENYIDTVQEDALSSYPLTITSETADMGSMMTAFAAMNREAKGEDSQEGIIEEVNVTASIFDGVGTNDLRSFKAHLEENYDEVSADINTVRYTYSVSPMVYTLDLNGNLLRVNPSSIMGSMSGGYAMSMFMSGGLFNEMIDDRELINSQYETVAGRLPENYDELLLVLTDKAHITDFLEYTIGLKDPEELQKMVRSIMNGESADIQINQEKRQYTYDDLLSTELRLIDPSDLYRYNEGYGVWEDMTSDKTYMRRLYESSEQLKIVGIVAPAPGSSSSALSPGICYLPSLTLHVMDKAADSVMVRRQLLDRERDVISGKTFDELNKESGSDLNFEDMISVDGDMIASAFNMNVDTDAIMDYITSYLTDAVKSADFENTAEEKVKAGRLFAELADGLTDYIIAEGEDVLKEESGDGDAAEEDRDKTVVLERERCADIVTDYLSKEAQAKKIRDTEEEYLLPEGTIGPIAGSLLTNVLNTYINDFPSEHGDLWKKREELQEKGILLNEDTVLFAEWSREEIRYGAAEGAVAAQVTEGVASMMRVSLGIRDVMKTMELLPDRLMGIAAGSLSVDSSRIASAFKFDLSEEELTRLMSAYSLSGSKRSYEGNLNDLGYSSPDEPASIVIYLKDFEGKENFISFINRYNDAAEEMGEEDRVIRYTDMTGILMASVKTILDAIAYVLIAFVSISLIVSSIMIGVITLISVQERTKEIGILRAIGASKRNVSSMFNAETVIIGFMSGIIGTGMTYLICIPVNAILHKLTGISTLSAFLPPAVAGVLILISTMLTLFAGIIPSASAARKDPVVALRTE